MMGNKRTWIGIVKSVATKTVLVKADTRKEAEEKLRDGSQDVEGIDVHYEETSRRIIREDN